jgi:copper homeostasis protein
MTGPKKNLHTNHHMMDTAVILEICAGSVTSALAAQEGGADRVELCDNLLEGGTTPSYAAIVRARELLKIALYPIIRPRGGDFLYDDLEFDIMSRDIALCRQLGCDGVVIGLLTAAGTVDKKRTKLLVELAWPMGVTFHRAFDRTRDPEEAMEDIIQTGCERILSSGQRPTAPEGAELLAGLVRKAAGRIAIMVGSGVREDNVSELVRRTKATEYHSTAKSLVESNMRFGDKLAEKGVTPPLTVTDAGIVRRLRERAQQALNLISVPDPGP